MNSVSPEEFEAGMREFFELPFEDRVGIYSSVLESMKEEGLI